MKSDGLNIQLQPCAAGAFGSSGFDVFIADVRDGAVFPALELTFSPTEEATTVDDRGQISTEVGQEILDALWQAGLRPTGLSAAQPVIEAKDAHIAFAERTVDALVECQRLQRTS